MWDVFQKILVPIDGSEHAERALGTALNVATRFTGAITLMHVYSLNVFLPLYLYGNEGINRGLAHQELSKLSEEMHDAGVNLLTESAKKIEAQGIPVETRLTEGHVMQEIVKTAQNGRFDLIVMGAKGESKIKEMLLGSVSEKVVRNAPCAVLIVK